MTDERLIYDGNGVPRPNPAFPEPVPTDEPEHFKGQVFEGRVVAYLLEQLSEEEVEQFEDECFAEECWPSRIKLVEDDLIDAYLHDELSPEQHRCFEQNYLTTEERQQRVRMAAALLRQVCEPDPVPEPSVVVVLEKNPWAKRLSTGAVDLTAVSSVAMEIKQRELLAQNQDMARMLQPRAKPFRGRWQLRTAFAVAALIIVAGGFWLYHSRVRPPLVIATLKLTSSVSNRSEDAQARTIKLPPDAGALRVFMMLPNNAAPASRYRVELDTEDETIPVDVAEQDAQSVSVVIPAAKLPRGRYFLQLFAFNSDGTEQPVYGSYTFTVE